MKRLISFILVLTFIFSAVDMSASATGEYYMFSFDAGLVNSTGLCGSQYNTTCLTGTYQLTTNDESLDIRAWAVAATGIKEVKYNFDGNGWEVLPETAFSARPDIYDAATGAYGLAVIEQNVTVAPITPEFSISIPIYDLGLILDSTYTFQIQIVTNAGEEILIADLTIPYVEYYVSTKPQDFRTRGGCIVCCDNVSTYLDGIYVADYGNNASIITHNPGKVDTINFFGWISVDQEADWATAFGYSVDDGEIVYDDGTKGWDIEPEEAVINAGRYDYNYRFSIDADVTDLTLGAHTVKFYCQLVNGEQIIMNTVTVEVTDVRNEVVPEGIKDGISSFTASSGCTFEYDQYVDGSDLTQSSSAFVGGSPFKAEWSPRPIKDAGMEVMVDAETGNKYGSMWGVNTHYSDHDWTGAYTFTSDIKVPDSTDLSRGMFVNFSGSEGVDLSRNPLLYEEWCTVDEGYVIAGTSGINVLFPDADTMVVAVLTFDDTTTENAKGAIYAVYDLPNTFDKFAKVEVTDDNNGNVFVSVNGTVISKVTYADAGMFAHTYDQGYYKTATITDYKKGGVVASTDNALIWKYKTVGFGTNDCELHMDNFQIIPAKSVTEPSKIIDSGTCGENLTWTLDEEGTLTISGAGNMTNYEYGDAPWYSIRSSVKSVIIGDGVTSIGSKAFSDCSGFVSVTIGDSVTSIGYDAFYECSSLTSVTIPDSVTNIGEWAFAYCSSLTSVTIGNGVTSIGESTFEGCYNLTSVTIPDSVTSIGNYAFCSCSSLTSVTILDSVTSIGGYAFAYCENLTSITVDANNEYYSNDEYGVLFNRDKTTLIQYPIGNERTSYVIPDGVTIIGYEAFYGCDSLTSVTIGDSVTSIGERAFEDCSNLVSVTIGDGVTSIGERAFSWCDSLTSVTIGDSVTSIGEWAFYYCSSLTSVTIPDSVISIGDRAFYSCDSLTSITVDANNEYYSNDEYGVLFNKDKTTLIQYPIGNERTSYVIPDGVTSIGNYAFCDCSSLISVTIPDSVTNIGEWAFEYCSSLTSVTIPDSVTSIGDYAFRNCESLTSVTISDSVTSIGKGAFFGCSSLTSVTIDGVTSIGDYAFRNCESLTSVTIGNGVTSIGDRAFYDCSSLTDVYYGGSELDWEKISIGSNNDPLINANIHFEKAECEHAYGEWEITTAPGCETDGEKQKVCSLCGDAVTEVIPANGHIMKETVYASTCTEDGYTHHYCENCAYAYDDTYVDALGHSYGEWKKNDSGKYERVCSKCGNEETETNPIISSGTCGENLTWTLDGEGTLTISGTGDMTNYSSSSDFPWSDYSEVINKVIIENGVTSIGDVAFFGYKSLISVVIPDSITDIGVCAFSECSNIAEVHITDIAKWCNINFYMYGRYHSNPLSNGAALYLNGDIIEHLDIPLGVTSICDYVFSGCVSFVSITIPDSITSIGSCAFSNCSSLKDVYYSGSEVEWAEITICSGNDPLINANIVYAVSTVASGTCGENLTWTLDSEGTLTISGTGDMTDYSSSSSVPWYSNRSSVKSVIIGDSVTSIGSDAFSGCSGLVSVTIGDSVTSIGQYAFEDCSSLTSVTIPDSVISIGNRAFVGCESLVAVTIPDSVTSIGEWVFAECSNLASVTIPDGVISIGNYAFYKCSSLTSVTIPDGVTSVGQGAFYYCTNLMSIIIPDGVTAISRFMFSDCTGLISVTIPNSVISIDSSAFDGCTSLVSVTIPDSVMSIGSSAFDGCTSLVSVSIPNSVVSIGHSAFCGCRNLKDVTIGNSVTSIETQTFNGCENLTFITIGNSVTNIANAAFGYCKSLKSVTIPDSVVAIAESAFSGCKGLTSVTIGNGVLSIGASAFSHCSSLVSVSIGNSVTSIGNHAFYGCSSLKSITIPDGVTVIAEYTFYDCSSLASVTIPISVTNIGDFAFYGCVSLTDVYYGGSESDWLKISIDSPHIGGSSSPNPLFNATIHFSEISCSHVYSEWEITTAPGCETDGEKQKVCSLCGDVVTEVIPANGHSMKETVIPPTCTEEGYTHHYCENCTYTYDDTYVDALGHSYGDWVTDEAPTCTIEGRRHKVCGECGHTVYESVEKVDHKYEQKIIPPTYFEEGYTVYTCSACGHTYNDNYVDVLKRIELSDAVLELEYNSVYYKGVALTPDVSLIYNGETHDPAVELKITYLNNDKIGTATVIVEGINKFKGTVELKFEISYETIPEKIVNFVAIGEIGKISLSWGQSSEVSTDSYNIYRKADGESDYQLIKTIVGRTELYFEDTNVEKRKTYSYYITGVGLYGAESEPSLIATATVLVDEIAPTVMKMTPVAASVISKKVTLSATVTDNVGVAKVVYFYSVDNGATWIKISESTNKAFSVVFDVSELESGALNVKAIAYDAEGNESDPFAVAYSLDNTGPDKVTGLSAVALSSKITLSWNDVEANDAAYFILQVKSGDEWKNVANNIKTLGYVVNNLQANTDYTYRVACVDARGNIGEYSDEFTARTVLDQTAPVITNQSPNPGRYNSTIRFSATAKDDCDINIIEIQISTDLLSWTTVSEKIFTVQTYSQTYTYTIDLGEYSDGSIFVRAIATDFSGNLSDTSSTAPYTEYVVDKTAPVKPAGVTASGNDGYITVSWNMGNEADIGKYFVYRATSSDGEYQLIYSNLSSINYHDRNVQRETYYYYKIKVSDACGNMSEFSDVVSATMSADTQKPEITSISTTYQQKISKKNNTISISATDNNRLSYIAVEYCTSVDSEYVLLAMEESIDSNYKNISVVLPVESLTDGDIVYIRAYAVDMAGNKSGYATQKYTLDTTPPMISDFTASLDTSNVYLNWQDCGDDDLAGFRIYRSGDGENFVQLGARGVNNSGSYSFIDTINDKEDNIYIYKLEAVDKIGNTATWTKSVEYEYVYINQIPVPVIDIPGSMAVGVEEVFDASKSTDDIVIVSYLWNFGDGTTSDEIKPAKSYEKTGVYTVTLSITDNEGITSTITKEVTVKDRDLLGTLNVRITDENDKSLPYVPVYFDLGSSDQKIVYTDASGVATLQMLSGSHTIGMYTSGYLPVKKDVVVLANATRTVTLTTVKEDIVTGNFEITRMDFDEILAAGIDVYDPANQNVYAANVRVTYGSTPPITIKYVRNDSKVLEFGIVDSNGKLIDHFTNGNGETRVITGITYIPTPGRGEGDVVAIMDMPAEASYLKEFFDVRLHIINNASSEFTLEMNEVLLNVPNGMTLMNSVSGDYLTSNIANIPSIRGQETVTLAWVLRGDKAGEYDLSADFTGILSDFNELVTARFETEKPIKVYGLEGVKFRILTADKIYNDTLYFNIELENERDIDIYMPSIGLTGKIKNITESVLNENVDGDFLAEAYILNAYIQSPNGNKQYLPVTYDENGKANTNIKVLAPGQKLVYEYVAYNAINYAGIAYFKEAAVLEFEGMIENIEVGSFSKDYYSFNDYTAKLDTILGATDPAVNEAFDYMMTDYNFYYVSEARGLNVSALESLYKFGDTVINFDLSSLTNAEERDLVKRIILSLLSERSIIEQSNDLMLYEYNKAAIAMIKDIEGGILTNFVGCDEDLIKIKDAFKDFLNDSMDFAVTYKTEGLKGFKNKIDQDLAKKIGKDINISDELITKYNDIKAFSDVIGIGVDVLDTIFSSVNDAKRESCYFALLKLKCNEEISKCVLDKVIEFSKEGALREFNEKVLTGLIAPTIGFNGFIANGLGVEMNTIIYQEAVSMRKDLEKSISSFDEKLETVKNLVLNGSIKGAEAILGKVIASAIGSTPMILISLGFNVLDGLLGWENYVKQHDTLQVYDTFSEVFIKAFIDNSKTRGHDDDYHTMFFLYAVCEIRLGGEAQFIKFITDYSEGKYRMPISDATILKMLLSDKRYTSVDAWIDNMQYNLVHSRDILFNVEKISEIETPRAPVVTLDYDKLQTVQSFTSEYEYCFADGVWIKCNNEPIAFSVGVTPSVLRVRKAASDTNFVGNITTVKIFARKDLSKLITVKFDGMNYMFDNLSPQRNYQVVFTDDYEADIDWGTAQTISGSDSTVMISGVKEYSNVIIRSCQNSELQETTSNPLSLAVSKKKLLNLIIDGSGAVSQTDDSGCYFNGESIDLVADANTGNDFIGWFIDGVCVSSDEHYIVEMYDGLEIVAQFTGVKIKSISIENLPVKLNYYEGEDLDFYGLKLLIKYSDDTTAYAEEFIGYLTSNTVGTSTVIITYGGFTASYDITIDHNESDWITTMDPTTFNEGLKIKRCSHCHKVTEAEVIPMLADETGIVVDNDNHLIYNIPEDLLDSDSIITHYDDLGCGVKVLDADSETTDSLMTGGYIVYAGTKYAVVVSGDITGDGEIDIFDVLGMLDHVNGDAELEGVYEKAGLVVNGEEIDIFDALAVLDRVNSDA